MPNKMERFTQRARRVLSLAQEAAETFQHHYIGTEHLLLGLMREEGGVAARVLSDLGVDEQRIEEQIRKLASGKQVGPNATLDLSPDTKRSLELAVNEARRMGHHFVGTEHLLLGMVEVTGGAGQEILKRLKVPPDQIRLQTRRVLQEPQMPMPVETARYGGPGFALRNIFGPVITSKTFQCDVYMLMPYAAELQPVYNEIIRPSVEAQKLVIKRADDFYSSHDMIREIWSCIVHARYVIADCTGRNPNVYYELGIAHTLGKQVILITQNLDDLPFSARGKRALVYENTPEGREKLGQWLKTAFENIDDELVL